VGYGQLAWPLRTDARVTVLERTNARNLTAADIGGAVDLVVGDLSFISLRLVLPALAACADPDADMVLLVKPQFEAGRDEVGRGGVVRDPAVRAATVREVAKAARDLGWGTADVVASPLPGPAGNIEFFLWLRQDAGSLSETDLAAAVSGGP
jgi:23S rRNA (cytidine1920-2'-O)/16S rRNA (cytidine1409-2'-O)-methyltransferase